MHLASRLASSRAWRRAKWARLLIYLAEHARNAGRLKGDCRLKGC
jgi:hypothetical protein